MANNTTQTLLLLGLAYVAYKRGLLGGLLGPGGAGSGLGATLPGRAGPCDASFIPGVRYVENRNGVFNVVIGGAVVFSSPDQATAEREYNRRVCGG